MEDERRRLTDPGHMEITWIVPQTGERALDLDQTLIILDRWVVGEEEEVEEHQGGGATVEEVRDRGKGGENVLVINTTTVNWQFTEADSIFEETNTQSKVALVMPVFVTTT